MFITEIQKLIWEPATCSYNKVIEQYKDTAASDLANDIIAELERMPFSPPGNPFYQSIHFMTCGCPHFKSGQQISSCTFCDFVTPNISLFAKVSLLRDKSIEKYSEVVMHSVNLCKKRNPSDAVILFFSGFDTLSNREVPEYLLAAFERERVLDSSVTRLIAFEARAGSVTRKKLRRWKRLTDIQLGLNIGVEVGDEWLRNHWINKGTYNWQIDRAVLEIKQAGYDLSLSVLLGIPGLSQRQSIELFVRTFSELWEKYRPDTIMCGPQVDKPYTLQHTLQNTQHPSLIKSGVIVPQTQTFITAYITYEALYRVICRYPEARHTIKVFKDYISLLHQNVASSEEENQIIRLLRQCINKNDYEPLVASREKIMRFSSFQKFLQGLEAQDSADVLSRTMWDTARVLTDSLAQSEDRGQLMESFQKELNQYQKEYSES